MEWQKVFCDNSALYSWFQTPMISYVNVHAVLEGRRNRAKASPTDSDLSEVLFDVVCWVYGKAKMKI